ncbi:ras guanine nucleotide exchange factor domain-containing protein [Radiomyces spectabilis]|uniref:ras guanine nucleotide exchange factor domain-containing protein n=1 Tax=Radiomyces spectabilis TaxID=64574 RepID=UPI00221F0850|nr:ras guanine nucleotide exchange factor domain-containing protein [Radiomyces spectabilis]KAI8393768.1 ras guanine nucleotide exchange factor domain-containing protein [Radiomyces spectabilis]
MEDVQSSLAFALEYQQQGQLKDAYMTYLSTAQQALRTFFDVRFVHCSIVSPPPDYHSSLTVIRECLKHLESMLEPHGGPTTSVQNRNVVDNAYTGVHQVKKIPPPPVPPKPSVVHHIKPVLPPKPMRTNPCRPPSSFSLSSKEAGPSPVEPTAPWTQSHPRYHVRTQSMPSTASYPSPSDHADEDSSTSVLYEDGQVDPTHLVPAQTHHGDTLIPLSSSPQHDHVPLIPIPPLLTTHRILQSKLDELELALKDYRERKQQAQNDPLTEDELNQAILRYTPYIAEAKHTLNRVRTLYMSAATIPTILHFQPSLVAYQLTTIESAIFRAIPSHALLEHHPRTPHPRVVASTDFFNFITRSIEHSILLPQEASSRAQHINHWITIASKCHEFRNYQSLKAIVCALGTPPVERLRRTWAYIPKKSMAKLDSLMELMSEAENYGRYREHMGMVSTTVVNGKSVASIRAQCYSQPTVPFLGTFIHDMTYLITAVKQQQQQQHQPSENVVADDPRVADLLHMMEQFQACPAYPSSPPSNYVRFKRSSPTKHHHGSHHPHHHIRPVLSKALQRSKSGIGRLSGGASSLFGNNHNNSSSTSIHTQQSVGHMGNTDKHDGKDDDDLDEQQKLITHFILMRPWVSEALVDELSTLREPPRQKSMSFGRVSSGTCSGQYSSSVLSNASSIMRFSISGTSDSRPSSVDDTFYDETGAGVKHTIDRGRPQGMDNDVEDLSQATSGMWPYSVPDDAYDEDEEGGRVSMENTSGSHQYWETPPTIPPRPSIRPIKSYNDR